LLGFFWYKILNHAKNVLLPCISHAKWFNFQFLLILKIPATPAFSYVLQKFCRVCKGSAKHKPTPAVEGFYIPSPGYPRGPLGALVPKITVEHSGVHLCFAGSLIAPLKGLVNFVAKGGGLFGTPPFCKSSLQSS